MSEDKQLKLNKFEQDNTIAQPYLKFLAQSHNSQFNNIYNNNNLNMNNSSNQNNQNESYSSESSKNINLQTKPFSGIHQMQQIYKNQQKVMKKIMPNNTSQSDSMSQKKKRTSYKAELDTNSRPREKRVKERTILYVLKKVVKWRKVYDKSVKGQDTSNMNVEQYRTANLKQAAEYVQLSRKTLDDYFSMIRRGYNYNFDFRNKYKEKMGVLRQHIKEIENNGGKMKSKGVDVFKIWDMVTEGRSIDINDFEEDELDDDSYEYEDECEDGYQETENAESNINTETSDIGKKKMKMNNQDEQYIGNNRYEILQNLDMSKSQLNQSFNKSSCQNNLTSQSLNEKQNGATENNNNNNTSSMESESSEQQKVLINPAFNQVFKEKYSQKNQQDNKSQQQNNRLQDIQVNQSQSLDGPLLLQNKKNSESISMQTNGKSSQQQQQNGKVKRRRQKQSQKQQNQNQQQQDTNQQYQQQNPPQMGQYPYQQNFQQDFLQQQQQQQPFGFNMGYPFQGFQMPYGQIPNSNFFNFGQKLRENQQEIGKNNQQMIEKNYSQTYQMYNNLQNNGQLENKIKEFSKLHFEKIFEKFNTQQQDYWKFHLENSKVQKVDGDDKKFKVLKFRTYSYDDIKSVQNTQKDLQEYGYPYYKIYEGQNIVEQSKEAKQKIKEIKKKWNQNFTDNKEKLINLAMDLQIPMNDQDFKSFNAQFAKNSMVPNLGLNQFQQAFMWNQPNFIDPTGQIQQPQMYDTFNQFQQPNNPNQNGQYQHQQQFQPQNGNLQPQQQEQKSGDNGLSLSNKQLSFQRHPSQQQDQNLNKKVTTLSNKQSGSDSRNGTKIKQVQIVQQGKIGQEEEFSDKQNSNNSVENNVNSENNSNNNNNNNDDGNNKIINNDNSKKDDNLDENKQNKTNDDDKGKETQKQSQNMEIEEEVKDSEQKQQKSDTNNNNISNNKQQIKQIIKPVVQQIKQED